jgi:hypothetical protein
MPTSHEAQQKSYLSLRLPHRLAADLKRAADREANTTSAVARRLIATGLSRECRSEIDPDGEDRGRG